MNLDFSFLLNAIKSFFVWFGSFITDLLLYIPKQVYSWIIDAALAVFSILPSLSFIDSFYTYFQSLINGSSFGSIGGIPIGLGIVYIFGVFKLNTGISLVSASLLARFILRRIPLFG
jgi:hypothetical protein